MEKSIRSEDLEIIAGNIPDLIVRMDSDGRIRYCNAASKLYFNKTPEESIGQFLETLLTDAGLMLPDPDLLNRLCQTGQAEMIEADLRPPLGESRHVEIRILPEPIISGEASHLVVMIRDVTRRKKAEREIIRARNRAEESDQRKSAFLANMSHEIRTPLNAIVGFSQIILEEDITREEQERFYSYINQNSNQLIGLVNDIIDLSRLECNQLTIRNSATNLNQVIEEMTQLAGNEKRIRDKDHLLLLPELDPANLHLNIMVDEQRLKQLLTNLLVNAIKFTPKGYIQFGYKTSDPEEILFFVRDTGIGIARNRQEEVFDYFRQLDNGLNRTNTGTGLGLAICKRLVALMDGNIWLQSEPGRGTSFFFTVPFHKV